MMGDQTYPRTLTTEVNEGKSPSSSKEGGAMRPKIRLVALKQESNFVPLGVLGYCLTRTKFLALAFAEVGLKQKAVEHEQAAKLQDLLVGIRVGCHAVSQLSTLVAGTLNALGEENLCQLRKAVCSYCSKKAPSGRIPLPKTGYIWLSI